MNRRWLNVSLALGTVMILPVYRHMHYVHQLVQQAKSTSIWKQIPTTIPKYDDYLNTIRKYAKTLSFYAPRFFYVNAIAEVDGKKQIWVNGRNYGASCPWPLYHTFDRQTNTIKKGDLRPRLALTSKT